ncbi:MAG: TGS domain-containing protein, partial [Chloroflexota bacterium]
DMEGENHWGVVYAIQQGKDISHYRPVEILTPTGGTRFLPEGSTVLDAVASIQQEFLLDKISAVKVNGALVRLSDRVHSGDVIEVITDGTRQPPTEEWLAYANNSTARLLRSVLVTEALKKSAEKGRQIIKPILAQHGILALEDVQTLEPVRFVILLETLAASSLEDLYASVGSGAIRELDFADALINAGITQQNLNWTTFSISGTRNANRPGVLARLAHLVSQAGGNILRSVNDTQPDGGFYLRLVIKNLSPQKQEALRLAFLNADIEIASLEVA